MPVSMPDRFGGDRDHAPPVPARRCRRDRAPHRRGATQAASGRSDGIRQDRHRVRAHPPLGRPISPHSLSRASTRDHRSDQRQVDCQWRAAWDHHVAGQPAPHGGRPGRVDRHAARAQRALHCDGPAAGRSCDHRARGRTREHLIGLYPEAALLGMTATPCRGDGRGLGNLFDVMIEAPQVAELIVGGYLVKSRVYAPVNPDLKGVRVEKGDYVISQLAGRMNTEALVGDIVEHWHKHGEGRCTIAFAVNVAHSVAIRNQFLCAGVSAEHLDGETPISEREAILTRLASGETKVVSNCMVLTEGWDCPPVGCAVLARPTKQMGLFRQMIGRVLRPADGKADAIVLDHSGAVFRHGLPEDHVDWTLDTDRRATTPTHEKGKAGQAPALRECPSCKAIMIRPPWYYCGWEPKPRARDVEFEDGQLGLVVGGKSRTEHLAQHEQLRFYRELRGFAHERGMKDGWAFHKCKEKGFTPPWAWKDYPLLEPSPGNAGVGQIENHRLCQTQTARGGMTTQDHELIEAWRAVANAKLTEFRRQCWRLALLVRQGFVDKTAAVDRLYEIAIAHALVRALGEDRVEAIIAEAFAANFREVA